MRHALVIVALFVATGCAAGAAPGSPAESAPPADSWVKVTENQIGPRFSPALVYSSGLKRFVLIGGQVSHEFKGERPYDVQSMAPPGPDAAAGWSNDLPALPESAKPRGGPTGNVRDPGFKSPWYAFGDDEGLAIPNRRHMVMWYQYAPAPWDGCVYALVCGRTLRYDPKGRTWAELNPPGQSPMPLTRSFSQGLSWSAMCADPVNREVVLFGGCGLATANGSPGTWIYSPERNQWRRLRPATDAEQPPPRALAPMVFDPQSKRIVLFGGDRLDQLYADTWLYDCATRTWKQAHPPVSPSPRFGHAMLYLPKAQKVLLVGGKGYSSSTSYLARLYKPLPLELWTYDVAADRWTLIGRQEEGAPPQNAVEASAAAVSDDDVILLVAAGTEKGSRHSTWRCRVDAAKVDQAGTAKFGVPPGTVEVRSGPFDPEYYTKDLPPPDPAATAAVLKDLPANQWVALDCPRWPANRQGGGWSTVALDTDGDQIVHMGGGHSSYFGNDQAHYDIATGRWSIACRPQFALEYNYGLSGPGAWAFNGFPWGNHNYHAYAYDPTLKRVVYVKDITQLYDPARRAWPFEEKLLDSTPFFGSKYTCYLCTTPKGVVAWAWTANGSGKTGVWRLEGGKEWTPLPAKGDKLPLSVCDGSTISYDSKRDRLVLTTTPGKEGEPGGQVWSYDFATGQVSKLNPEGAPAIAAQRFAREAVYLPKADVVLIGYVLDRDGRKVTPIYDCAANRWLAARIPGCEFIPGRRESGASVDLGLVYDPKRDLVWATLCSLRGKGALNVLRLDRTSMDATPIK